jgi:hypothetical protein
MEQRAISAARRAALDLATNEKEIEKHAADPIRGKIATHVSALDDRAASAGAEVFDARSREKSGVTSVR